MLACRCGPVAAVGFASPAQTVQPRRAGRSAAGDHAGRVRGVPAGPRRLHRGRDGRRRPRPGVQRHELRRVPQRAGDRRRRRRRSRCAPATATTTAAFRGLNADGDTLIHLFSMPDARLPADDPGRRQRDRAPRADSAVRRRARRGDPRRDAARRSTIRAIAIGDGVSGRAAIVTDVAHRRSARRALRMEGAACDAARVRRRRLSQRDGHHQRLFPHELGVRHRRRADALCDPIPDPEDHARSADAAARHRQLRGVHEVPRAGRRAAPIDETVRAGERAVRRRSAARRATCRRCRPGRARTRCSIAGGAAVLRSAAARHRHRRRDPAGRGDAAGDPDAGAVGSADCGGRCCTTAGARRSKTRSAAIGARPNWPCVVTHDSRQTNRRASWPSCVPCDPLPPAAPPRPGPGPRRSARGAD